MTDPRQITFPHRRSADQDRLRPAQHPVVIVGAGPVGLVAALALARKGHRTIVIDRKNNLSDGSRAICWAKRTLEIMDRLGLGEAVAAKGVTWKTGTVFFDTQRLFEFDLLPETAHRRPAFVNLQQYYFEHFCIEAARQTGLIELRWQEEVQGLEPTSDGLLLNISTPTGDYRLLADWLIAADGARSAIRRHLQLGFEGRVFDDQFLICDIKMRMERPAERWFWFDPPFNRGRSALLHKQADDVWRLDFQIGATADRVEEMRPANVARRVRAMLGEDVEFSFEWISLYRFQSRRLQRFRHGHVLFAGDAAHQMSPFGARGGNSGIQDADNLAWKLDLILRRLAPATLLDSYDAERIPAADENLLHTTRSTDFIAPKSAASRAFRDGVLALAETEPLARRLVNSGRLSVARCYDGSPLNGPDGYGPGDCPAARPGAAALDAPVAGAWLLDALGHGFSGVWFCREGRPAAALAAADSALAQGKVPVKTLLISDPIACCRYGAERQPAYYLFRPDQHVVARWRGFDGAALQGALARATGRSSTGAGAPDASQA
ncbi:MAG TPA: FAD-dependent oxidoreductase [Hyphomicrobiaceae bacterium]|jgi:3-(3-hydroxy-phenyl)propionate hydroxylase|nr:FAD-dependent oxidoreductase [Hyphomicrobiaceae bacterium]